MSHELRTPLSAIIGFSALMRDEPLADGQAQRARRVDRARAPQRRSPPRPDQRRARPDQDRGRADQPRARVVRARVGARRVGRGAASARRPQVDRHGRSTPRRARSPPTAAGCGRSSTTCSPTPSSSRPRAASITVEGRWSGDEAHIAVTDTGVGIAAEDLEHIFEEFRQVGDLKAREAGTGLGLALCRRLAEAHGGALLVTSEVGRGSRFEVVLPDRSLGIEPPPRRPRQRPRRPRQRPSILVIEDDPGAVRLLRTYLEGEGYDVEVATDGEAGIAAARAQAPGRDHPGRAAAGHRRLGGAAPAEGRSGPARHCRSWSSPSSTSATWR